MEGPVQFQWWGDVLRAAYLIQMRTWSSDELDQWVQLVGCSQTDMVRPSAHLNAIAASPPLPS